MTDMKVALRIVAQDHGSQSVRRAIATTDATVRRSAQVQQSSATASQRAIRRETVQTGRSEQLAARQRVREQSQAGRVILNDARRMNQARSRLGITSERALQNEITRTAIAYRRLEQSGRLSGRELARAADAAQARIRRLQTELNRSSGTSRQWGKGLAAIGGGALAGAMTMARPLSESMGFDRQVALISNTAYADQDATGRKSGQDQIKAAIRQAVQAGGGTREAAADGLYALLGDGGLGRDDAYNVLPTLQKMGLAAGKSSADLVPLVRALSAQNIQPADLPDALGKILYSAETGGFGLDSMIAALPQVLQQQKDLGMSGMVGLNAALANMQGITQETGLPEQAAQSTVALLQSLRNPAVAKLVSERLSIGRHRVDLAPTLTKGVAQDVDPLETFAATLDKSMGNHKGYATLKKAMTKSGATQADMERFSALLESTVLRDLGIDKGAIAALTAYMRQRENIAALRSDYAGRGVSAISTSADVLLGTDSERLNQASQAVADARNSALQPISQALGEVSAKLSDYASQYPGLTSAVVAATDAIKIMTAAALAFGGIKMLTGGRIGGPIGRGGRGGRVGSIKRSDSPNRLATNRAGSAGAPRTPTTPTPTSIPTSAPDARNAGPRLAVDNTRSPTLAAPTSTPRLVEGATTAKAPGWIAKGGQAVNAGIGRAVPAAGTAVALMQGYEIATSQASDQDKGVAITRTATGVLGSTAGAYAGGALGATIGSVVPIIGTAVGSVLGSILGGVGGGMIADAAGQALGQGLFDDEGTPSRRNLMGASYTESHRSQTLRDAQAAELSEAMRRLAEPRDIALDVRVQVDVENGNIVAAVNETNAREARRY